MNIQNKEYDYIKQIDKHDFGIEKQNISSDQLATDNMLGKKFQQQDSNSNYIGKDSISNKDFNKELLLYGSNIPTKHHKNNNIIEENDYSIFQENQYSNKLSKKERKITSKNRSIAKSTGILVRDNSIQSIVCMVQNNTKLIKEVYIKIYDLQKNISRTPIIKINLPVEKESINYYIFGSKERIPLCFEIEYCNLEKNMFVYTGARTNETDDSFEESNFIPHCTLKNNDHLILN